MQIDEACALLGVEPGASANDVRLRFHEQMREAHPDVATSNRDNDRETDPALLTRANEVLRRAIAESADGRVPRIVDTDRSRVGIDRMDRIDVRSEGQSLWVTAPPDETFQRLLEASSTLGGIGHVDRALGLLEVIVRFEGGPTCSVLMTLQGRSYETEIFCEMESIESNATPAMDPVLEALQEALGSLG